MDREIRPKPFKAYIRWSTHNQMWYVGACLAADSSMFCAFVLQLNYLNGRYGHA